MNEWILEVENLKKYYTSKKGIFSVNKSQVKAVDGVSFTIKRGQTMGLVGESGCGKTTTGKTILSLIPATGGKVIFESKVVFNKEKDIYSSKEELRKLRKDMQIIFQDPYACLDPRMTVLDIVTEGIKKYENFSKSEIYDRAEKILLKCGLGSENLLKYPHQFSGGQRQRIGIARALSVSPKFVVCDEPTAALDVSIQSQILNLMMELKQEMKLSYLFISHDLTIVRHFCDEICVMYLGTIVEKAPAEELFSAPFHPYTKALLSAVPQFNVENRRPKIFLSGELPSLINPPSGCLFNTRCPYKTQKCIESRPLLKEKNAEHYVACHYIERG